jgi:hypothetical protein
MRDVIEIIVVCIGIAVLIGMFTVIFMWWWIHLLEKQCSPTDAEEERECNKYEHWHEAGNK